MRAIADEQGYVDAQGRVILPDSVLEHYGLKGGSHLRIDKKETALVLYTPVDHVRKVYLELTNKCNLVCRTCIRNTWDEPIGEMSQQTFEALLSGLRAFSAPPTVVMGGFGEPLAHPNTAEMVTAIKSAGCRVELITNGTLLSPDVSRQLIEAGLDILWVSIDGASTTSYADIRLGALLPQVVANMWAFREAVCHPRSHYYYQYATGDLPRVQIGVVFVAMRRNIADLPEVVRLGRGFGAAHFLVTNVVPYTADMCKEILYWRALGSSFYPESYWDGQVDLPNMDVDEVTREPLYRLFRAGERVSLGSNGYQRTRAYCPFIGSRTVSVSWEGYVSPCLPLLHNHVTYLNGTERHIRRYVIGDVGVSTLYDLWCADDYVTLRERVEAFDFSPCTVCGGCDLLETNEEDCYGNTLPVCGGCLWGQGIVRCP